MGIFLAARLQANDFPFGGTIWAGGFYPRGDGDRHHSLVNIHLYDSLGYGTVNCAIACEIGLGTRLHWKLAATKPDVWN
jgi:hypothetical protein